jgi:hypothetical protein
MNTLLNDQSYDYNKDIIQLNDTDYDKYSFLVFDTIIYKNCHQLTCTSRQNLLLIHPDDLKINHFADLTIFKHCPFDSYCFDAGSLMINEDKGLYKQYTGPPLYFPINTQQKSYQWNSPPPSYNLATNYLTKLSPVQVHPKFQIDK